MHSSYMSVLYRYTTFSYYCTHLTSKESWQCKCCIVFHLLHILGVKWKVTAKQHQLIIKIIILVSLLLIHKCIYSVFSFYVLPGTQQLAVISTEGFNKITSWQSNNMSLKHPFPPKKWHLQRELGFLGNSIILLLLLTWTISIQGIWIDLHWWLNVK